MKDINKKVTLGIDVSAIPALFDFSALDAILNKSLSHSGKS